MKNMHFVLVLVSLGNADAIVDFPTSIPKGFFMKYLLNKNDFVTNNSMSGK